MKFSHFSNIVIVHFKGKKCSQINQLSKMLLAGNLNRFNIFKEASSANII